MEFNELVKLSDYEREQGVYITPKRVDSTKDWDMYDNVVTRAEFIFGPTLHDGSRYIADGKELEYFVNFNFAFSNSMASLNFLLTIKDGAVDVRAFLDSEWKNETSRGFSVFGTPLFIDDMEEDIIFGVVMDWREHGNVAVYLNDSNLIELSSNFSIHDGARTMLGFGTRIPNYDDSDKDYNIRLGFRTKSTDRGDVRSFTPMTTNRSDMKYTNTPMMEYVEVNSVKLSKFNRLINHFGLVEDYHQLREYRNLPHIRQRSENRRIELSNMVPSIENSKDFSSITRRLSNVVGGTSETMSVSTTVSGGVSTTGRTLYGRYHSLIDSASTIYDIILPNITPDANSGSVLYGEYNTPNKITAFQTRFFIEGGLPAINTNGSDRIGVREFISQVDFIRGFVPENEIPQIPLVGLDSTKVTDIHNNIMKVIPFTSNMDYKTTSLIMVVNNIIESGNLSRTAKLFLLPDELVELEDVSTIYQYMRKNNLKSWDIELDSLVNGGVYVTTYFNSEERSVGIAIDGIDYGYIYNDADLNIRQFGEQRNNPISFRAQLVDSGFGIASNPNSHNTIMGVDLIWGANSMKLVESLPKSYDINNNSIGDELVEPYNINDYIREGTYFTSLPMDNEMVKYFSNSGFGIDMPNNSSFRALKQLPSTLMYNAMNNMDGKYDIFGVDGNRLIHSEGSHNTIFNIEHAKNVPNSSIFLYKQILSEESTFSLGEEFKDFRTLGLFIDNMRDAALSDYFIGFSLKSLKISPATYQGYIIRDIKLGVEWDSRGNSELVMYYLANAARMTDSNVTWLKENWDDNSNSQLEVFRQVIPLTDSKIEQLRNNFEKINISITKLPNQKLLLTVDDIFYGDILPYNGLGKELRSNNTQGGLINGNPMDGSILDDKFSIAVESFPISERSSYAGRDELNIVIKEDGMQYTSSDYYPIPDTSIELMPFSRDSTLRNDLEPSKEIDMRYLFRLSRGAKIATYNRNVIISAMSRNGDVVAREKPLQLLDFTNSENLLTKNQTDFFGNYGKILHYDTTSSGRVTKEYEKGLSIVSEMYSGSHDKRYQTGGNTPVKYVYHNGLYYTIEGIIGSQKILQLDGNGNVLKEVAQLPLEAGDSNWEELSSFSDSGYIVAASLNGVFAINPDNPSSAKFLRHNAGNISNNYRIGIHDVGNGYGAITFRSRRFILFDVNNSTTKEIDSPNPLNWDMAFYTACRGPNDGVFYIMEVSHNLQTNTFSEMWLYNVNKDGGNMQITTSVNRASLVETNNMGAPALWGFSITYEDSGNTGVNNIITYESVPSAGKPAEIYATTSSKITVDTSGVTRTFVEYVRLGGLL